VGSSSVFCFTWPLQEIVATSGCRGVLQASLVFPNRFQPGDDPVVQKSGCWNYVFPGHKSPSMDGVANYQVDGFHYCGTLVGFAHRNPASPNAGVVAVAVGRWVRTCAPCIVLAGSALPCRDRAHHFVRKLGR
jgi:hypothetical protein